MTNTALPTPSTVLVTGAAGFIGFHCCQRLLSMGHQVIGLDNLNDYYDVRLKQARLAQLQPHAAFRFFNIDLADRNTMQAMFEHHAFDAVLHLGAQAGVRYSIDNPFAYIDSNITGMLTVLEGARHHAIKQVVYASSSSVYGANTEQPFAAHHSTELPVSLYAATKKADELMSHAYAHLYGISLTGLRFFTVYGPWGRPDMAYFKFAQAITRGEPIEVFNHGHMWRDFTYIDDIVDGVMAALTTLHTVIDGHPPHRVFNLGNDQPERLSDMIDLLEQRLERPAQRLFLPMQAGDVLSTHADISSSREQLGYAPKTSLADGLSHFVTWFRQYYGH